MVVPNDYNPFQDILQKTCGFAPWWIAPPHHINYFDVESIQRLLVAAGFDVLHTQTTFPIDIFLLMGDNYIGNDVLGRQCHARRDLSQTDRRASDLKRRLYQSFAALGIGREVLVCGRKP